MPELTGAREEQRHTLGRKQVDKEARMYTDSGTLSRVY